MAPPCPLAQAGADRMSTTLTFTDATGAATLTNDWPVPADRFSGWTPTPNPVGDGVNTLATGALIFFEQRTDYGASFDLENIPVKGRTAGTNYVAIAARLIAHLKRGGTCTVNTGDASSRSYATCGLWPGASPSLTMTDRKNLLYKLSLQVLNLAASPVAMDCVYAP